jgi:hypothetical protein
MSEHRVGIGIDAHAFGEGVPLVLGGVAIDYPRGLVGHSDGDVIQNGGTHGSPVNPLLHTASPSREGLGVARAKPGSAHDVPAPIRHSDA